MATKKVGKAAALAARKSSVSVTRKRTLPKRGDAVWINGAEVLGIFVGYSAREKVVTLRWSAGCLIPYAWPENSRSFFNVEKEDIAVLSPEEVLSKVDWLVRVRDESVQCLLVNSITSNIRSKFFPNR